MTKQDRRYPQRVRNELRFRELTVLRVERIGAGFQRIVLGGEALAGFNSRGFDDHTKVFFPEPGRPFVPPTVTEEGIVWGDGVRPASRDYTPLYDEARRELSLDFFIHDGGVASSWASAAQPGDRIAMGGPRGSCVVPVDYVCQIYVCDETGLPAFKRRYQEMQAQQIHLLACVDEPVGRAYLGDLPDVTVSWLGSGNMQAEALTPLLDPIMLPADDYFIWLTGEGAAVKQLSDYFTQQRAAHSELVRAVAYWHQK